MDRTKKLNKLLRNAPVRKPIINGREQPIAVPIWQINGDIDTLVRDIFLFFRENPN